MQKIIKSLFSHTHPHTYKYGEIVIYGQLAISIFKPTLGKKTSQLCEALGLKVVVGHSSYFKAIFIVAVLKSWHISIFVFSTDVDAEEKVTMCFSNG